MEYTSFQQAIAKRLSQELSRMMWNKHKTVKSFSIDTDTKKITVKAGFSLPAPFSSRSSIMIIIRNDGTIDKWAAVVDGETPPKQSRTFDVAEGESIIDESLRAIVKYLLQEIGDK